MLTRVRQTVSRPVSSSYFLRTSSRNPLGANRLFVALLDLVDSIPGIDSEDAVRACGIFARLLGIESFRAFSKVLKLQRESANCGG